MDSSADTAEMDALLDRVASSLTVSDQQRTAPEGQSLGRGGGGGGIHTGTDPEEDCFYDCEESLGSGERASRTGCPEASHEGQAGDGQDVETDGQTDARTGEPGEQAVLLGERSSGEGEERGMEGGGAGLDERGVEEEEEEEEEEEKEKWDECADDGDMMADGGRDSDAELKGEESAAPEFDDEQLREEEKDLTEEEKERRREESLALKEKGNSQFKNGEHAEAEESYTLALGVCPVCYSKERAVLFSNRAAARIHLEKNEKAIADCTKAIELKPDYVRARLRRAELYERTDKLDEALEDYQAALEQDPSQAEARDACRRLPQQIHERNEKLKEEMMGKLKDLGNMFLRPFGLSTSNFQVNQDQNTGSYSVNFVQNANNNR